MKSLGKILAVLLLLASSGFASYFLEDPAVVAAQKAPDLPTWRFGATFSPAFYLNSFGFGGSVSTEYRLHKNHSLDLFVGSIFTQPLYEVGLDWRFFFTGDLMTSHHDDFLLLGASVTAFESFDKYYYPPRISAGYGRDILFFDKANFLCRLAFRLTYIFGESIPEKDADLLSRTANFVTYFDFSIFFF